MNGLGYQKHQQTYLYLKLLSIVLTILAESVAYCDFCKTGKETRKIGFKVCTDLVENNYHRLLKHVTVNLLVCREPLGENNFN